MQGRRSTTLLVWTWQASRATDSQGLSAVGVRRQKSDWFMLTVGVGSVPFMFLELVRDELSSGDRSFLLVINVAVAVVFAADYIVELALSDDRWGYVRSEKLGLAIVVSTVVALVPAAAWFGGARLARLAPAVRAFAALTRLLADGGLAAREGRRLVRQNTLRVALAVTGLVWVSAAVTVRLAEGVGTVADSLWWSAATITTVGYGDLYPVTPIGRLAGVFAMVVGISAFGVLTARLAAFLSQDER